MRDKPTLEHCLEHVLIPFFGKGNAGDMVIPDLHGCNDIIEKVALRVGPTMHIISIGDIVPKP